MLFSRLYNSNLLYYSKGIFHYTGGLLSNRSLLAWEPKEGSVKWSGPPRYSTRWVFIFHQIFRTAVTRQLRSSFFCYCQLPADQLLVVAVGGVSGSGWKLLLPATVCAQFHSELSCSRQELLSLDLQESAGRATVACSQPGVSSTSCCSQVLAHPGRGHLRGGAPRLGQVCSSLLPLLHIYIC